MISIRDLEEEIYKRVFVDLRSSPRVPEKSDIKIFIEQHWGVYKLKLKNDLAEDYDEEKFKIDINKIIEKISRNLVIETDEFSIINISGSQHVEWLDRRRSDVENGKHWNAYKEYQSSKLSKDIIDELDRSTDRILSSIEDPQRQGEWQSKGLVIGDVQSGKTTNFLGVVAKAIDTGYKIIIILSGLHNNLRVQTQARFEEGITGFNTKRDVEKVNCGVANIVTNPSLLRIDNLTSRNDTGDFRKVREPGSIFRHAYSVNKKNVSTLVNLIKFIKDFIDEGQKTLKNLPLLLIDDEADNASLNTQKNPDLDPSRINGLIKELLGYFEKSSYIGYTATPFANVLVDPENNADLFPRNFIMTLGCPDNYIGATHVFGQIEDDNKSKDEVIDVEARETETDWFRNVDYFIDENNEYDDWIEFVPDKHKKTHTIEELPVSLEEAIFSFIISVSIRRLRGDENEHKTMLIHVTRFKDVQAQIVNLVDDFVENIYSEVAVRQFDHSDENTQSRIEDLFNTDFQNTGFMWNDIKSILATTASLLKGHVYGINGDFKDIIDEDQYPDGLVSIRVGGDKLSRGLTLPGLMTSYFLRTSRMYDTLMQMGRWFGYRDNYEDLCRIYTTGKLFNWYGHISMASEGLRARIKTMNARTFSPLEYQQRIQSHPGMLMVTALNKQYHSRKISVSYNDSYAQISGFDISKNGLRLQKKNLEIINNFIEKISKIVPSEKIKEHRIFRNVEQELIKTFINNFNYDENNAGVWSKDTLINYIKEMNKVDELINWSVILFSNSRNNKGTGININEFFSKALIRSNICSSNIMKLKNSALMSAGDQKLDLSDEQINNITTLKPTASDYRAQRSPENGLLILYVLDASQPEANLADTFIPACGISFPKSQNSKTVTVVVNSIDDIEEGEDDEDD